MNNLLSLATRAIGGTKLLLMKNAPGIMTYGGVIVVAAGIYMFCKATMDLEETLNVHDERVEEIKSHEMNEKETEKLLAKEQRRVTFDLVKLYGPAATTTICGFALILGGHHLISQRSAAISAAYKALEEGYSQYRKRVREDLGEEADRKYLYGLKKEQTEVIVKDKEGNEKLETTDIYLPDGQKVSYSPYARFFDEFSTQWTRNPEYNLMFLNAQQAYANDKLHAVGHLFLNEVYEMLGLPHSKAGSVVGWVLNKGGDNCVDFGIYDLRDRTKHEFVNGYEPSILLDFNVDGVIYDLI